MASNLLSRLTRHLRNEILQRRLPHGLLSPAYLWPGGDRRVRLHRQFWWRGGDRWPRPLWLMVQGMLWLRWVLIHAIPACRRTCKRMAPLVEAAEGLPQRTQRRRVLNLALFWCITPGESYRFRLYRDPRRALDYIYDREISAYHAWRSAPLRMREASLRLIQDKMRFGEELARQGIPVASAIAGVSTGTSAAALEELMAQSPRLFCKMNSGNQGRGAFAVWRTEQGLAGRTFTGEPLPDSQAVEQAWRKLLELDAALIQPCLENHPDLAPLAYEQEVITVRFISQWEESPAATPSTLACLSATLEVPAGRGEKGHTFYSILPIAPETGRLLPPIPPVGAEPATREALDRVQAAARTLDALPDWSGLVSESYRAHRLFPDIRAIAWDWVLTPAGPVLLEGNTGWGTATPQILHGGLLAGIAEPCAGGSGLQPRPAESVPSAEVAAASRSHGDSPKSIVWRPRLAKTRQIALLLLAAALLAAALYGGRLWWRKHPYIAELPRLDRPIDARRDHYTRLLLECPKGEAECPARIVTAGRQRDAISSRDGISPDQAGLGGRSDGQGPRVEILGNPAAARYPNAELAPARAPWDLFAHNGRLYIGLGNDDNEGPVTNAGPVPLIAYDPATDRFIQEAELPEEQIDRFYRFDGALLIPGDDPRQSWDLGNLYRKLPDDRWQQRRTLPRTIHTHALAWHDSKLFAGGNTTDAVPPGMGKEGVGSTVSVSADQGETWTNHPLGGWRIFDFLQVAGRLYAADAFPGPRLSKWLTEQGRTTFHSGLYEYGPDNGWHRRPDLTAEAIFPDTPQAADNMGLIQRAQAWRGQAVYIGAFAVKKGEVLVRGGYLASRLDPGQVEVRRLPLPESAQVWDLEAEGERLWLLYAEPLPGQRWRNRLVVTEDGLEWREVIGIEAPAIAQSFARLGGEIYIGLGAAKEWVELTGVLLRIRGASE